MASMVSESAATAETEDVQRQSMLGGILGNYLLRRLFRAFLTIFFVSSLTFFLVRLLPGSPVDVYINQQISQYGYSYEEAARITDVRVGTIRSRVARARKDLIERA